MENEIISLENNSQNLKKEINELKRFIDGLLEKYAWLDP